MVDAFGVNSICTSPGSGSILQRDLWSAGRRNLGNFVKDSEMDAIEKQASIARRRLTSARFLAFLPYTLGGMLLIALLAILLPKVIPMQVDGNLWVSIWLSAAVAVGLLINCAMTWIGRPSLLNAAEEIDRRFHLRERVSSSLAMQERDSATNFGQALAADARRKVEALDIPSQFGWGWNPRLWLPLLPALASLLFFVIPDRPPQQPVDSVAALTPTQVKNSTQPLLDQIRKKREEAELKQLDDAADLYRDLQTELEKLQQQKALNPKEALAKLNDIKEQLDQRRNDLGSSESLKKNLRNLDKLESGPADQLAESLKQGDFEKAEQALGQLLEDLQNGKLDSEQMEKLNKQLQQLEEALRQAAQAHEQAKQNLREQIRKAQENGDADMAGQLQRKLEQLQASDCSISQLQEMADKLSQCQNCMSQSDTEGLKESLSEMAGQLREMNLEDSQLQDLDQVMDSLSQCKSGMCEGRTGEGLSQSTGDGIGRGSNHAEGDEEDSEMEFFDSQVRAEMTQGQMIFGGKIGGENRKGVSRFEVQQEILRELSSEPEPLDDSPLPRNQRDHTRDYFNQLREGT
jgi:hypothetical protein